MNIDEPLRSISSALDASGKPALRIEPGRWHVLFSARQRPLLMPVSTYRLQERCLRFFVGNRLKGLYARVLLKANALMPNAGLLPEFRLPRARAGELYCNLRVDRPSHAAIQIGSSGPYQKASVLLVSDRGEALMLAKIAMARSADERVLSEAGWLRRFENEDQLTGWVPRLLAEGRASNGRRYLVTTIAPSTDTTTQFTRAHTKFLRKLGRLQLEVLKFIDAPCSHYLTRTAGELQPYVKPEQLAVIEAAVRECENSLSDWTGPFVIAQGDFAPWNIRVHQQQIYVFDWEYAREGANPLADTFNYFLIQRSARGRQIGARFLAAVIERAERIARVLYPEWRWHRRIVSAFMLQYLLEILLYYSRADGSLDLSHPIINGYWNLICARSAWIAA